VRREVSTIPQPAPLPTGVAGAIEQAVERRRKAGLPSAQTDAYRLVHDAWDRLPGLQVDAWGRTALLRARQPHVLEAPVRTALRDALLEAGFERLHWWIDDAGRESAPALQARERALNDALAESGLGVPADSVIHVRELSRTYEIQLHERFSPGLFTDMRPIRQELVRQWRGRRVCNLFAHTCAFGVALAGRNQVVNVDVSQRYLDWGRRNYEANHLEVHDGHFVCEDVFQWLDRAVEEGRRFDAVVLDPPAWSRGKGQKARSFSVRRDLGQLVEKALDLLATDGELLVSTNLAELTHDAFRRLITGVALDRDSLITRQWGPAADYPMPAQAWHLKALLLRRTVPAPRP
jgi:23S rRNA (cytosine1962-C5)-methyltransferase